MRCPLAIAVAFVTVSAVLYAQTPVTGTIVGRVVLTTRVRSSGLPSTIYQPRGVANHHAAAVAEVGHVVVSLKGVKAQGPLLTSRREIQQIHEEFVPRVVAVTRGSTVDFPNADPIFHNVFSLASAATFDLGRYPQGRSKSTTLNKPGLVKVYCHIHSQMSATIVVFDHPYFTLPADDGSFTLTDVPAGAFTIAGWHERVGERTLPVAVRAGEVTSVTLRLPLEEAQ